MKKTVIIGNKAIQIYTVWMDEIVKTTKSAFETVSKYDDDYTEMRLEDIFGKLYRHHILGSERTIDGSRSITDRETPYRVVDDLIGEVIEHVHSYGLDEIKVVDVHDFEIEAFQDTSMNMRKRASQCVSNIDKKAALEFAANQIDKILGIINE